MVLSNLWNNTKSNYAVYCSDLVGQNEIISKGKLYQGKT